MSLLANSILIFHLIFSPGWIYDFEKAKEIANKENRFILLNFSGSDWCGPCIKMEKVIFSDEYFLQYAAQHLVLVNADFPRSKKKQLSKNQLQHNEALAEKYNSEGKFPYTLLLDAKGNIVKAWDGYDESTPQKFVSELQRTLNLN